MKTSGGAKMKRIISSLVFILCIVLVFYLLAIVNNNNVTNAQLEKENSQENILDIFNVNYTLFLEVTNFVENQPNQLSFQKTTEKFYSNQYDGRENKSIDTNSLPVGKQILRLINDLGFKAIITYDYGTLFTKQTGAVEKGLIHMRNDVEPNSRYATYLKENWYYYEINHN